MSYKRIAGCLHDWLFRLGIARGVLIEPPPQDLIEVEVIWDGRLSTEYRAVLNQCQTVATWLLHECDGPWRLRFVGHGAALRCGLAFARSGDAVVFRLLTM